MRQLSTSTVRRCEKRDCLCKVRSSIPFRIVPISSFVVPVWKKDFQRYCVQPLPPCDARRRPNTCTPVNSEDPTRDLFGYISSESGFCTMHTQSRFWTYSSFLCLSFHSLSLTRDLRLDTAPRVLPSVLNYGIETSIGRLGADLSSEHLFSSSLSVYRLHRCVQITKLFD